MQEMFVNFAVLWSPFNLVSSRESVSQIPNLILSDLSPLGHVELLSRSLVCNVLKVDGVFVRELPCSISSILG